MSYSQVLCDESQHRTSFLQICQSFTMCLVISLLYRERYEDEPHEKPFTVFFDCMKVCNVEETLWKYTGIIF